MVKQLPLKNKNGNVSRIAVWLLENAAHGLNEELAATNEELAATNEELAATNEEFAAANEELAAANEEMAAANEELVSTRNSLEQSEKLFRSIALNIPGSLIIVIDKNQVIATPLFDIMAPNMLYYGEIWL